MSWARLAAARPVGSKHKGLKTSREIHDRIQWDASLDERAFTVVYEERFTGRRSRAFVEFPTDGEIPWHRVWEYRVDELVVWGREDRIARGGHVDPFWVRWRYWRRLVEAESA